MERPNPLLLEALKQAAASTEPARLFRSGKLAGLFASRAGSSGEAAAYALQHALVEVVRAEPRGKTVTEWVRATPKGIDYVHRHESPAKTLRELQSLLQLTCDGLPNFVADLKSKLEAVAKELAEETRSWTTRLEAMRQQVEVALRRLDLAERHIPAQILAEMPWATEAIGYLDRRQQAQAAGDCSLPELYASIERSSTDLTLAQFQAGLRVLRDRKLIALKPFMGSLDQISEPEHALPDGERLLYYATTVLEPS